MWKVEIVHRSGRQTTMKVESIDSDDKAYVFKVSKGVYVNVPVGSVESLKMEQTDND